MTVKIPIKGDVMDSDWGTIMDSVGMTNVNPTSFQKALNSANGEDVELDIASNGGIVESATEIASLIHDYAGKVTTVVQSAAYSAASIIAVSGDVVKMAPTALMMIHRASVQSAGNTNDLSHDAIMLATVDKALAAAYQAKTGKSQEEILNLMNNETWLTAQDAVDQGFADEIQENAKELVVTNSLSPLISAETIEKLKTLKNAKNDDVEKSHQTILNNKLKILKEE